MGTDEQPYSSIEPTTAFQEQLKKCLFCAELIQAEARVCRHCGRAVPDRAIEVRYRGPRAGVGATSTSYAVWDLGVGGAPLVEFPKTADGWQQAWARFQAVDPQGAQIYQSAGAVAAQAPHTSGFAIASLVLGIVGGVVLGLVFGYVALNQIKKSGGTLGGRGLAIAGITLGWVWLGIIVIAAANSGGGY